jgi:hypothetical protein
LQELKLTTNAKTKFSRRHRNTVGFNIGKPIDGGTCPHATEGEGGCLCLKKADGKTVTCYMHKLITAYPNVKKALQYNTDLVKDKSYEEYISLFTNLVERFKVESTPEEWKFRLNYAGDFETEDRARAWAAVIKVFPEVTFWTYTRDHIFAKYFKDVPNITFYFSIDKQNKLDGYKAYEPYKNERNMALAYMGEIGEDNGYRFIKCPETYKLKQNTDTAGACASCGLCWRKVGSVKARNIQFKLH